MTPEEIQDGLAIFHGTETYYQYMGYVFTDGVKFLAEAARCYWLLDIVSSYLPKLKGEEFVVVTLKVADNSGQVVFDDGNGKKLIRQTIPYTDFPLPEIKLFLCSGVLMLPTEY